MALITTAAATVRVGGALAEPAPPVAAARESSLLHRLAEALAERGVRHCQWKGHRKRARWLAGEGDVDLLVAREHASIFEATVAQLGFKAATAPAAQQTPGVVNYYGWDPDIEGLLHLHTYHRLIVGSPWRREYHLPLEDTLLGASARRDLFAVPAAEHDFIITVLRTMVRLSPHHAIGSRRHRWLLEARSVLDELAGAYDPAIASEVLASCLPEVDLPLLEACRASLGDGEAWSRRLVLRGELLRRLALHARPRSLARSVAALIPREETGTKIFAHGGTMLTLAGGDGSGKSTCATALKEWLGAEIRTTRAHFGLPPRSFTTLFVGGMLKASRRTDALWRGFGRLAGRPMRGDSALTRSFEYLRFLCTARDRYHLLLRIRRFTNSGGVAVCERYPLVQTQLLAGPEIRRLLGEKPGRVARLLDRVEQEYYRLMVPPELVVVLRLEPEVAVRRKTTEPPDYVRARTKIVWETDWTGTGARVVDADQPLPAVLREIKSAIWSAL